MTVAPGLHVICALPGEADTLPRRGVEVSVCGVGAAAARDAAERSLRQGARVLLSWGVAGGLAPTLRPGDLFVPCRVTDGRGRHWSAAGRAGTLLTVSEPVIRADDKEHLWRTTACEAVDMESAAIAEACANYGALFVSVRAIADPAARSVPAWVPALLDRKGRPRLGRLAGRLISERGAAATLRTCMADYRSALASLRDAATDLAELVGAAP